ncbi:S-adenosyl-L-methionine-dependent methyltransferase [Mycena capillaripes]|nr:S-adenosyl-L-methionine-dependent methyltransferase [Mycena capillaripes]
MGDTKDREIGTVEYWENYYAKSDGQKATHEWLRSWSDIKPFLSAKFFDNRPPVSNPRILHLGSGDSVLPDELAALGYEDQLCLDFSPAVVELMRARHGRLKGIEWMQADVRSMDDVSDASVDLAFDKGMLDAMIYGSPWHPPDEVKDNVGRYIKEVHRALKDDGLFLCVSFRQPHFIKPFFTGDGSWDVAVEVLGDTGSFGYHAYTLRKSRSSSTVAV